MACLCLPLLQRGEIRNERKPTNEFYSSLECLHAICGCFTPIKHLLYSKLTSVGEKRMRVVSSSLSQPAGKFMHGGRERTELGGLNLPECFWERERHRLK